jgi:hypothetical protein
VTETTHTPEAAQALVELVSSRLRDIPDFP